MALLRVHPAEAYREHSLYHGLEPAMGSYGDADHMLFQQNDFPDTYNPDAGDLVVSAYSDRIVGWYGTEHWRACVEKYAKARRNATWLSWMRHGKSTDLLAFCVDVLKAADVSIIERDGAPVTDWTGFRICCGVNRATQYDYWTFEVFSKGAGSKTKTYSGQRAPNVRGQVRPKRRYDDFSGAFGDAEYF